MPASSKHKYSKILAFPDTYYGLIINLLQSVELFCAYSATPKGAAANALVYTLVEMVKANELNIYKHLTYLLEHRPSEDMLDEECVKLFL